jgi:hypothetical protein
MALTNVYLWLDGIEGESHQVWIELATFSWGVQNDANYKTDQGAFGTGR